MENNSLTDIVKSRREAGEGVFGSLAGAAKERLKERMDWKRLLPQGGLLTALFPKLKAYKAQKAASPTEKVLKNIDTDFALFAKNSKKLESIANNFLLMKREVNKLAKLEKVSPATNVDRSLDAETGTTDTTQPSKIETEKGGFNILLLIAAVAAVATAVTVGYENLKESFDSTISESLKPLLHFGSDLFEEFENIFDWTELRMSDLSDLAEDTMDFFKENLSKLFNMDVLGKIKDIANNVISKFLGTDSGGDNVKTQIYDPEAERNAGEAEAQHYMRDRESALVAAQNDPNTKTLKKRSSKILDMEGLLSGENALGNVIASGESRGAGYNAYNKGTIGNKIIGSDKKIDFSSMTLDEYFRRSELPSNDPDKLFAVGKYQIIPDTMKGIVKALGVDTKTTQLTPDVQESFFKYLVSNRRNLNAYLKGKSDDLNGAILDLAKEWAAVGVPYDNPDGKQLKRGQSYYSGTGGNAASLSPEIIGQALVKQRSDNLTSPTTASAKTPLPTASVTPTTVPTTTLSKTPLPTASVTPTTVPTTTSSNITNNTNTNNITAPTTTNITNNTNTNNITAPTTTNITNNTNTNNITAQDITSIKTASISPNVIGSKPNNQKTVYIPVPISSGSGGNNQDNVTNSRNKLKEDYVARLMWNNLVNNLG